MSTYAVSLDYPNATMPDVLWRIHERDATRSRSDRREVARLWVPTLEAWLPDTLRMLLHELASHLPPHDAADARVTIEAERTRRRGRAKANAQNSEIPAAVRWVRLQVEARGWAVSVWCDENLRSRWKHEPEGYQPSAGEWLEPMAALLLDLAGRSPLTLAAIADVMPATAAAAGLRFPSHRHKWPGVSEPEAVGELSQQIRALKKRIEDLEDDL